MPCDYSQYPPNWKSEIRPAILERCGHKCFFCGVKNYTYGYRDIGGVFFEADKIIEAFENDGYDYFENELKNCFNKKGEPTEPIKIILTIMHLDHDTDNNEYNNLAAGCQKCHLNYDKYYHRENSKKTRNKKKKLQSLF